MARDAQTRCPSPDALGLRLSVNGQPRQDSNTRNMILGVRELIELASSFFTLYPGDVFFTGTPEGVSPIQPGDTIIATIERIGTMTVKVRAARLGSGCAHEGTKTRNCLKRDLALRAFVNNRLRE